MSPSTCTQRPRDLGAHVRTRVQGVPDGGLSQVGRSVTVRGWVRTIRAQKQLSFVQINDGSNLAGIQTIVDPGTAGYDHIERNEVHTGCSVEVIGDIVASPGGQQKVEIKAREFRVVGTCDPESYPLQKKKHSLEFLREVMHLRPRTNTISAVTRVRSALAFATHEFFQGNGFQYLHTPLISASDCEGAGEMFQVTTLLAKAEEAASVVPPKPEEVEAIRRAASEQGGRVKAAKEAAKADAAAKAQVERELQELLALKEKLAAAEELAARAQGIPRTKDGRVDYSKARERYDLGDQLAMRVSSPPPT